MKHWPLARKIVAGFLVGAFLSLVVGLVAIYSLRSSEEYGARTEKIAAAQKDLLKLTKDTVLAFKAQVQAWKDILIRGNDPQKYDKYKAEFLQRNKEVEASLAALRARSVAEGIDPARIDAAAQAYAVLTPRYLDALANYDPAKVDSYAVVDRLVAGIDREPTAKINALADDISALMEERVAAVKREQERHDGIVFALLVGAVAAGFLAALGLGFGLARGIAGPIREIVQVLAAGGEAIAGAAREVSSAGQTLASGASEQAASLEETNASLEEIGSMTKRNAENAASAQGLSADARAAAET
ncbi:MAG TPA: hypothetical protein VIM58_06485, partial [Candidatus Methylacidiphilales bacterium]